MAVTIPPDTRAVGTGNPPVDMDDVADVLNSWGMAWNACDTAWAGGADPTGTNDSTAAINAAIAALPAAGGSVRLPAGTYKVSGTLGPLATNQWVVCSPGVRINFSGTGDCFRWVDTSTYTTRTKQGGGITGRPVIDGTSAGAGSTALHAGDILGLRYDIAVQNFTGAGDIPILHDNQNYWTEQATGVAYITNCTSMPVFSCGGAATSAGSFDRGDFTFYVQVLAGQQGVTWQNGAFQVGGRVRQLGNYASSASALSTAVMTITGTVPAGHPNAGQASYLDCEIQVNVEVDGGLANAPQTISFGSSANNILNSSGNINFGEAGNFAASNITTLSSQFVFSGPVIGDPTLSETTIPDRLAVNGEAFFHGQISTLLAASVSYKPSNPAGTVSATAVMMGLGSTCTFTPGLTGKVRVTICGTWYTTTVVASIFSGRYGTGTAPANGVAVTGTRFGTGASDDTPEAAHTGNGMFFSITEILSLAAGTAYWFDLAEASAAGDTTETGNIVCSIDELLA